MIYKPNISLQLSINIYICIYCKDALAITLPRRRHHECISVESVSLQCGLLGDDRRITPMQAVKNERLCLQNQDLFQGTSEDCDSCSNLQVDSKSFCKLRLTRFVDVRTQLGACGKDKQEALVLDGYISRY